MAKSLANFKAKLPTIVLEPEVLEAETDEKNEVQVISSNPPQLQSQTLNLLDQLEKAGFRAIAEKFRELQVTEGLEAIDPYVLRLKQIESHIDDVLKADYPLDPEELQRLLNVAIDAYQARAKALLIPYGSISPRSVMPRQQATQALNVAIGIGNGVTPKAK